MTIKVFNSQDRRQEGRHSTQEQTVLMYSYIFHNIGSEDSIEFRCTEFYDVGGMVSGLVVRKSRII